MDNIFILSIAVILLQVAPLPRPAILMILLSIIVFMSYSVIFTLASDGKRTPLVSAVLDKITKKIQGIPVYFDRIVEILFYIPKTFILGPSIAISNYLTELFEWVQKRVVDFIKAVIKFVMEFILFQFQEMLNIFLKNSLGFFGFPLLKTIKLPSKLFLFGKTR